MRLTFYRHVGYRSVKMEHDNASQFTKFKLAFRSASVLRSLVLPTVLRQSDFWRRRRMSPRSAWILPLFYLLRCACGCRKGCSPNLGVNDAWALGRQEEVKLFGRLERHRRTLMDT